MLYVIHVKECNAFRYPAADPLLVDQRTQGPGQPFQINALRMLRVKLTAYLLSFLQHQFSLPRVLDQTYRTDIFRKTGCPLRGIDDAESKVPVLALQIFHNRMVQYQLRFIDQEEQMRKKYRLLPFLLQLQLPLL